MEKIIIPAVSSEMDVKEIEFQIYCEDSLENELIITGLYGTDFEQACYIAITNLRRMNIKIPNYIHIHFLNYDFLKVGISCSLAIFSLLYIKIKKIDLKHNYLMTGEIDIEGNIHEIGVLNEKFDDFIKNNEIEYMIIPKTNKLNAMSNIKYNKNVIGCSNIKEVCKILEGDNK